MKGHKHHKSKGGAIDGSKGTKEEDREVEDKKDGFKKGGRAKKHKHGGKVEGKKAKHRADKRARGGAIKKDKKDMPSVKSAGGMSASSPLSGAGKTAEPKVPKNDKEDD
jgi:hypothetical protein